MAPHSDRPFPEGVQYGGFMAGLGTTELIIILVVVLLLFGGAKLPKLARSLGQAQSEFKKGADEDNDKKVDAKSDDVV